MLEHQGKKYARVSDILRPFTNFSGIDEWTLAAKAALGTAIHQAISDDIEGEFPLIPPGGDGYFESYMKWKNGLQIHFHSSEQRYFCDEKMITGQIDSLIKFPNDSLLLLVDFKTSSEESRQVWPMQAHLYAYLLEKNGIKIQPRYLFVKLDKKGYLPRVFEYLADQNIRSKCMLSVEDFWKNHSSSLL